MTVFELETGGKSKLEEVFENVGVNSAKILSERGDHVAGSVEVAADKLKDGMTTSAFQLKDGMTTLGFQLRGSVVLLGIMAGFRGGWFPTKMMPARKTLTRTMMTKKTNGPKKASIKE